jgi:hypothetical protein
MNHFKALTLAALTLITTCAWAGSYKVQVPPPNGTDDTANIQSALDQCIAHGPGCTVQFAAGTYHSKQIVGYNFRGTFKGAGMDHTIIEAMHLPVTVDFVLNNCQPNTSTCAWPDLIIFVDGDFTVSDLSIHIVAGTDSWPSVGNTIIWDAVRVMGQHRTNATFDRIAIQGLPDETSGLGYNVAHGILFTGELPRTPAYLDYYFLTGSLTVRNSFFKRSYNGVGQDGFVSAAHVTIGGSPGAGNHFEETVAGILLSTSQNSIFDVSYNEASATWSSILVAPWNFDETLFVPTSSSRYLIHNNKVVAANYYATGIALYDTASKHWLDAMVWNNHVELQYPASSGIDVNNASGETILNNTITGAYGWEGIGLWNVTRSIVSGNNVSGFMPYDGAVGQIFLNEGSNRDLVVCRQSADNVNNLGTNNLVVGCQK